MNELISIGAAIAVPVVVLVITHPIKRTLSKIETEKREESLDRKVMHAKIDCIVSGLRQMNGNTSVKFGQVYDKTFAEKLDEIKIVHK